MAKNRKLFSDPDVPPAIAARARFADAVKSTQEALEAQAAADRAAQENRRASGMVSPYGRGCPIYPCPRDTSNPNITDDTVQAPVFAARAEGDDKLRWLKTALSGMAIPSLSCWPQETVAYLLNRVPQLWNDSSFINTLLCWLSVAGAGPGQRLALSPSQLTRIIRETACWMAFVEWLQQPSPMGFNVADVEDAVNTAILDNTETTTDLAPAPTADSTASPAVDGTVYPPVE